MDLPEFSVSVLEFERGGSGVVVSPAGRAGIRDTGWLRQLLELQAARGPGRIVIDLSRLVSMDWWAVLIMLWVSRVVSRRGGTLVLASPQPAVARLLHAAGASQVATVYDGVSQAHAGAALRKRAEDTSGHRSMGQPGPEFLSSG
jgi:anti-anti-sigma factor